MKFERILAVKKVLKDIEKNVDDFSTRKT